MGELRQAYKTYATFGDLLKYLRIRAQLSQRELSIATGYSESQISRLERGLRRPAAEVVRARFVPALGLEDEPEVIERLLVLAKAPYGESVSPLPGSVGGYPDGWRLDQTSIARKKNPRMRIQVLGGFAVWLDGERVADEAWRLRRAGSLIKLLALAPGQRMQRDEAVDKLWPESGQETAMNSLYQTLYHARRALGQAGSGCLLLEDGLLKLIDPAGEPVWVDALAFQKAGMAAKGSRDPVELQTVLGLYGGDILPEDRYEEWTQQPRETLRQLWQEMLLRQAALYEHNRDTAAGIGALQRLLADDPSNEEAHTGLMRMYAQSGQRQAALRQFQSLRAALREELDTEPGEPAALLFAEIQAGRYPTAEEREMGAADPAAFSHLNLQTQLTSFIGRERELQKINEFLQHPACRLLVIYGLGGVGKTRLAMQVSRGNDLAAKFADGVVYVSLQADLIQDSLFDQLASTLKARNIFQYSGKKQILGFLREKKLLLVLDNIDLLAAKEEQVNEILSAAPQVKILAVCREVFHFNEAWLYPLKGLGFPPEGIVCEEDQADDYNSVQLFYHLARSVYPEMNFAEEKEAICRICQLVEGMPLALELAASWLIVLTCEQIVYEIETGLDIFSSAWENLPERHRSIRIVFDHSWKLLSKKEQEVLRSLAVFKGGFSREAAQVVAGATLPNLATLVQKSMVQVESGNRFIIHELLRQFIVEKDSGPSEQAASLANDTRERHSQYFLNLLLSQADHLKMGGGQSKLASIGKDHENIQNAVDWLIQNGQICTLNDMIDSLYIYYWSQNKFSRGEHVFSQIARVIKATVENKTHCSIQVLARNGAFHFLLGDYEQATTELEVSLAAAREDGDWPEVAFCLRFLGNLARWQGNDSQGRELYLECLEIYHKLGDQIGVARALFELGGTEEHLGDNEKARWFYEQSLVINQSVDNRAMTASCLDKLGAISFYNGEYEKSDQYFRNGLAIFEEIGDLLGQSLAMGGVAWNYWARGGANLREAETCMRQSLFLCRQTGYWLDFLNRLGLHGMILNSMGRYQECRKNCLEGLSISYQYKNHLPLPLIMAVLGHAELNLQNYAAAREHLSQALKSGILLNKLPTIMITLCFCVELMIKESDGLADDNPYKQELLSEALALAAFTAGSPITWRIFRDRAAEMITNLCTYPFLANLESPWVGGEIIKVAENTVARIAGISLSQQDGGIQ